MVIAMIIATSSASPCTAVAFRRGFSAALPFIVSNGIAGIAMGVAYRGLGLGFAPAGVFCFGVYFAPAQAGAPGPWGPPPPVAGVAGAFGATNTPHLWVGENL